MKEETKGFKSETISLKKRKEDQQKEKQEKIIEHFDLNKNNNNMKAMHLNTLRHQN